MIRTKQESSGVVMDINFLGELNSFISQNYVCQNIDDGDYFTSDIRHESLGGTCCGYVDRIIAKRESSCSYSIIEIPPVEKEYDSFAQTLFKYIDMKGISDGDACRRSGIDRRVLSKIRNNDNYTPTKKTIFAFAIGIKLTEEETEELLMKAGYAFSNTSKSDLIIQYFIRKRIYNIWKLMKHLNTMSNH